VFAGTKGGRLPRVRELFSSSYSWFSSLVTVAFWQKATCIASKKCKNSSDVSLTEAQPGQPVSGSNFREDVNANGVINSVDIALVKSKVGTALP
jgi:hypothetical protein